MICRVYFFPQLMKYETIQNLLLGVPREDGGTKGGKEEPYSCLHDFHNYCYPCYFAGANSIYLMKLKNERYRSYYFDILSNCM